jgi:hypothetical protein
MSLPSNLIPIIYGATALEGGSAIQLDGAALVATGQSTVLATVTIALSGATAAATGETETAIDGALATQLAGAALVARGQSTVLATLTIALSGATMAATTQLGGPIEGTLSTQLAGATLQALGQGLNMLALLSDITDRLIRIENQLIADTIKGATRYKRILPGTETVILDKDVYYNPLTGFTLTEHQEPPP